MRTKYALWLGTVILIPTGCTNHSAKTAARSGPSHEEESEDRDEDEADEMTESGSTENPEQAESAAGVVEAAGPSTTLALNEVAVGALPDGWKGEATSQKSPLATWKGIDDASGPSKGHVLGL